MEEPLKKRVKLSCCLICDNDPHEFPQCENESKYSDFLIKKLVPPVEKRRFYKKNIFVFCVRCIEAMEELLQLQLSLEFITKSIKKKENDLKCKILANRSNCERKSVKGFRDVSTRDFCPRIHMFKNNSLAPKKRRKSITKPTPTKRKERLPSILGEDFQLSVQRAVAKATKSNVRDTNLRPTSPEKLPGKVHIEGSADLVKPKMSTSPSPQRNKSPRKRNSGEEKEHSNCKLTSPKKVREEKEDSKPKLTTPKKVREERDPSKPKLTSPKKFGREKEDSKSKLASPKKVNNKKLMVQKSETEENVDSFPSTTFGVSTFVVNSSISQENNIEFERPNNLSINGWSKPPLTYVQLCVLAIMSTENMCMIVREIYSFYRDNFPYFKDLNTQVWENQVRNALRTRYFCERTERRYEEPFLKSGLKVFSVVETEIKDIIPRIDKFLNGQAIIPSMAYPERLPVFKTDLQKTVPSSPSDYIPRALPKPKSEKKIQKEKKVANTRKKKSKKPINESLTEQKEVSSGVSFDKPRDALNESQLNEKRGSTDEVASAEQQYMPNGALYTDLRESQNEIHFNQLEKPSSAEPFMEMKVQTHEQQHYNPNGLMLNEINDPSNHHVYNGLKETPYEPDNNLSNGFLVNQVKEVPYENDAYRHEPLPPVDVNGSHIINCLPVNNYLKPTITCEELCVIAIMNMDSMLVSASDVYDFIVQNFPSFYSTDVYAQLPCKNFIKNVLSQSPFYFYAKWMDQNSYESHPQNIGQLGCSDVYQLLYTVMYNYAPHFRKMIASKLSSKENMALMAFSDRVYVFIQNVLEKPIVPDFNQYIHQKMQNKMMGMELMPPRIETPMVENNHWVPPPAYTNANFPFISHNNVYPSSSTMLL